MKREIEDCLEANTYKCADMIPWQMQKLMGRNLKRNMICIVQSILAKVVTNYKEKGSNFVLWKPDKCQLSQTVKVNSANYKTYQLHEPLLWCSEKLISFSSYSYQNAWLQLWENFRQTHNEGHPSKSWIIAL